MNFHNSPLFLSCDWGTTSFRLTLVNSANGERIAYLNDKKNGIKNFYKKYNQQNIWSKEQFYLSFLKEKIKLLKQQTSEDINDEPIIISGMASSNIGLQELPYQSIPLNLEKPDLKYELIYSTPSFRHDIILISGLRSSGDIMRGEESQLLGVIQEYNLKKGCTIFPGTHSKHLFVKDNSLLNFKTYLTGELFDLLVNQSILQNSVSISSKPLSEKLFQQGVQTAQEENLLHSLFEIRVNNLLHHTNPEKNYDYLSGLLIGSELKELASFTNTDEKIIIVGENPLLSYYSAGLDYLQIDYTANSSPARLMTRGHQWILSNLVGQ